MDEHVRKAEKAMTVAALSPEKEKEITDGAIDAVLTKFDIETRLRQDVTNIIEPTFRKSGENEIAGA